MNTYKMSNIPLAQFRKFLIHIGCQQISIEGGHEKWVKSGCLRSIILQTHIDPIPEFIIKANLRTFSMTRSDFINWLKNETKKSKNR